MGYSRDVAFEHLHGAELALGDALALTNRAERLPRSLVTYRLRRLIVEAQRYVLRARAELGDAEAQEELDYGPFDEPDDECAYCGSPVDKPAGYWLGHGPVCQECYEQRRSGRRPGRQARARRARSRGRSRA